LTAHPGELEHLRHCRADVEGRALVEEVEHVRRRWWCVLLPVGVVLIGFTGCKDDKYPDSLQYDFAPYFRKEKSEELTEANVPAPLRAQLRTMLQQYFGKPRSPKVALSDLQEAIDKDPKLKLTAASLEHGSVLYRRHCLHCHGIMGDGKGPTGRLLNPPPRDFRANLFKFRSTYLRQQTNDPSKPWLAIGAASAPPSRADLKRTITSGIPGASMPAFNVLSDEEVEALVSYVMHLTLRGLAEYDSALAAVQKSQPNPETAPRRALEDIQTGETYAPTPPSRWPLIDSPTPDDPNWQRARSLFLSGEKGDCAKCHGMDGRANVAEVPDNAARKDAWGNLAPPRDLTQGWFRGGNRPIDLFYRIRLGISGTDMIKANDGVTDEEVWLLVNYVQMLSRKRN